MPSGGLSDSSSAEVADQHFRHTSVDPCWQQRDSRPVSPVQCGGGGSASEEEDSIAAAERAATQDADDPTETSQQVSDEVNTIRYGFDTWLAAFRKSRPFRDVIWRVGKPHQ